MMRLARRRREFSLSSLGRDCGVRASLSSVPFLPLVAPVAALSDDERARTARHASLAGFGELGQRRLAAAHVAVIGAGGLGSPVILALVAAGVGRLTVIDDDEVDVSNLHRQVIHRIRDVGNPKTASASRVAAELSPETVVSPIAERITAQNARRLLRGADLVIDGCDNFATRAVVADACDSLGVPLVWGVVQEFAAQITVFWSDPPPGHEPLRLTDLYPPESVGEPPSCAAVGVLGALCMQVGGLMASEAIKLIVGIGEPLLGRVVVIDSLTGTQREVRLRPRNERGPTSSLRSLTPPRVAVPEVSAAGLRAAQSAGATVLDVREPSETREGTLAGAVTISLADVLDGYDPTDPGPFIIVCAHGTRARRAAEALRARGHDALVLAGGLAAWDGA